MFIGLSVIAWLFVSYQTYKTKARKRVGYADQSRAASTAPAVGEPPGTPFSTKKEIRRGEISEKGKGGGWWGACGLARTGGAAQS